MPNDPLFPGQYRGAGQVALLCEGDAIGYEAQFLGMWTREVEPGGRQVDVWACGTGEGLSAMADAIGRLVRVVVIEDRDYRAVDDAREDCLEKRKDRERRGVAMRGWVTWERSEIENYFLDDAVLLPVMTTMFACAEGDVIAATDTALRVLGPYQALAATKSKARHHWNATDPADRLSAGARPKWTAKGLMRPEPEAIRGELEKRLHAWQDSFHPGHPFGDCIVDDRLLAELDRCFHEWNEVQRANPVWRIDWGGKEVLKIIRQQLAARAPGWWSAQPGKPVVWHALGGRAKQDDHDRRIERELQPHLVRQLLEHVLGQADTPIRHELDRLASMLAS